MTRLLLLEAKDSRVRMNTQFKGMYEAEMEKIEQLAAMVEAGKKEKKWVIFLELSINIKHLSTHLPYNITHSLLT